MSNVQVCADTNAPFPSAVFEYLGITTSEFSDLPIGPSRRAVFVPPVALSTLLSFPEPLERMDAETNLAFHVLPQAAYRAKASVKLSLLKRIRELRLYEDNWDGMGATVPSEQAIEDAEGFLRRLPIECINAPHIALAADGEVNFFWETERIMLDLGFFGDGTYSFFARSAKGEKFYGDDQRIESPLAREIIALLSRT